MLNGIKEGGFIYDGGGLIAYVEHDAGKFLPGS